MATLPQGLFGTFRGTIGNIVGSSWKGKPYIKRRPVRQNATFIPDQIRQLAKFTKAFKLMQSIKDLLPLTYRNFYPQKDVSF